MRALKATTASSRDQQPSRNVEVPIPKQSVGDSEMLHIRVDRSLKRESVATLDKIGMSVSEAVRLFLKRIVIEQALPLRLEAPNATTRRAIEASRKLGPGSFASTQELFDDLEKTGERQKDRASPQL